MTWLFGNYGRLSKDEKGEKAESKETQLKYNAGFVLENDLGVIVDNYFDDDISGAIFKREDLDRLKEDIESLRINAVVVKDLSRLGRSNAKTLTLIEYLEERNIRLVAINDNYDSLKDSDDLIGIKTWYNERYIKDISVKIRSNVHQKLKEGEYLGTPPFGYKKEYQVINNKLRPVNQLIVDEKIRPVIVEIFDLYIKGYGYRNIANILGERGYPNPSRYKNYNRPQSACWTGDHIRRIIKSRVYCGDTVQGTSERINYKSKKTRGRPKEKWYVKNNTHEPIVNRETWTLANEINKKRGIRRGTGNTKNRYLFSGFLQCGACGKFLSARKVKQRPLGYICSNYFHYGKKRVGKDNGCESHYIRHDLLEKLVYEDILGHISPEDIESAVRSYREKYLTAKDHVKAFSGIKHEIRKYEQQLDLMYEDRLNLVITANCYQNKARDVAKKLDHLRFQMDSLEREMRQRQKIVQNEESLKQSLIKYMQSHQLTRALLERSVKRIHVFLPGDINGEKEIAVRSKLNIDSDIFELLSKDGGIFVEYNFEH